MSFRTRLTSFFVVIVVAPMIAIGVLVFSLIRDSEQGKADARAAGLNTAAISLYNAASARAQSVAIELAHDVTLANATTTGAHAARARLTELAAKAGLVRVTLDIGTTPLVDVGNNSNAIAPGGATAPAAAGDDRGLRAVGRRVRERAVQRRRRDRGPPGAPNARFHAAGCGWTQTPRPGNDPAHRNGLPGGHHFASGLR